MSFKYERLPMLCHFCGILGHDLKHCATHFAVEKNGGQLECQYGDFLRAAGGRLRISASKHTSSKSNAEEGIGSVPTQNPIQSVQEWLMETMAAKKNGLGNPSSIDESDPMNPRTVTENTHDDSVDYDCHDNVKEKNALRMGLGPKIQQNVQDNIELNEGINEGLSFPKTDEGQTDCNSTEFQSHVQSTKNTISDTHGPIISKPKGTWTHINRMDFGLSGLTRAIMLLGLGKRDPRESNTWQDKEQNIKRGKVSNDEGSNDYVSVGVESHPCQE